jgi:hypothetical protein
MPGGEYVVNAGGYLLVMEYLGQFGSFRALHIL